jgi:glycogen(starch) synthase
MTQKPLDILVVSDLWPPQSIGGYELGASDVVTRLERRGHRITVLTSTYGVSRPCREGNVHRLLFEHVRWRQLSPRQLAAETLRAARGVRRARRFIRTACFDLIYLFNPLGLNAATIQELGDTGRPVVAYVSDWWAAQWPYCDLTFTRWMTPRPYLSTPRKIALVLARRWLRRAGVLTRLPEWLPVRHAQFVSRHIRGISARIQPASQEIIPWGIDVERFPYRERRPDELSNWIFVGQLEEHKGPHTAVEAVKILRAQGQQVKLTLYGDDSTPFGHALRDRVARDGLDEYVRFAGHRAREQLSAEAYDGGGLLVFPTMWEEPFSITLLEAFASGIPVLSTLTGGTGEIVRHGETATVFSVGNAQHLVAQYHSLCRHPERAIAMARCARDIVAEHLHIDGMVDRIESHLIEVSEGRGSAGPEPFVVTPHPWERTDVPVGLPTRAIEPDAQDSAWLSMLWKDLALEPGEQVAEPEIDSAREHLFPIALPTSRVLNGRFRSYLRGRVLNAGAGTVPIAAGTTQVRLDLQLGNRPEVCADLHHLPFSEGVFDAVFSIAVLEHCRRPWLVMRELRRVVRPGGHLLLSFPFMQPAHPNPDDYFRFTAEGMRELALDAGFVVLETGPDNSTQQTIAWMLWELLRHHPRHRYLASDPRVHLWFDRFSRREGRLTMPTLSNGFYLVGKRES